MDISIIKSGIFSTKVIVNDKQIILTRESVLTSVAIAIVLQTIFISFFSIFSWTLIFVASCFSLLLQCLTYKYRQSKNKTNKTQLVNYLKDIEGFEHLKQVLEDNQEKNQENFELLLDWIRAEKDRQNSIEQNKILKGRFALCD